MMNLKIGAVLKPNRAKFKVALCTKKSFFNFHVISGERAKVKLGFIIS